MIPVGAGGSGSSGTDVTAGGVEVKDLDCDMPWLTGASSAAGGRPDSGSREAFSSAWEEDTGFAVTPSVCGVGALGALAGAGDGLFSLASPP